MTGRFSYKGGCGARILRSLKEELVWVIDKWFWLISIIDDLKQLYH